MNNTRMALGCEECGEELLSLPIIVREHVLKVAHCPRCTLDPLLVLQD